MTTRTCAESRPFRSLVRNLHASTLDAMREAIGEAYPAA